MSVSHEGSSLTKADVTISPGTAGAGHVRTQSNDAAAQPEAKLEIREGGRGATYDLQLAVPSQTGATTDARAQVTIAQQSGSITVLAVFSGDKSAAQEIVLRDAAGTGIFLGGHMPSRGDGMSAATGQNTERHGGTLMLTAGVNNTGEFDGSISAVLKTPDGKVISQFDSKPGPHSKDVPAVQPDVWTWNHTTMTNLTPPNMPAPEQPNQQHNAPGFQFGIGR